MVEQSRRRDEVTIKYFPSFQPTTAMIGNEPEPLASEALRQTPPGEHDSEPDRVEDGGEIPYGDLSNAFDAIVNGIVQHFALRVD